MKKFFSGLALLTAVVALSSCEEDIFEGGDKLKFGENEVVVAIGGNTNGLATRSDVARTVVAPSSVIDLPKDEEDEMTISLVETVSSLDEPCYDAVMGTRGTPIYTENFYMFHKTFKSYPFNSTDGGTGTYSSSDEWGDGDNTYTLVNEPTSKGAPLLYKHDYGQTRWPNAKGSNSGKGKVQFFFEAIPADHKDAEGNPYVGERTYGKNGSISFHYTSPDAPSDQKDILFTSKDMTWDDHNNQDNVVLFYHALTGVKFKLSDTTPMEGIGVAINKITIEDLVSEGDCVVTPNYTNANTSKGNPSNPSNYKGTKDTRSAECSVWTPAEGKKKDYEIEFTTIDGENVTVNIDEDAFAMFPDDFDIAHPEYDNPKDLEHTANNNLNDATYSKTFMFIPQDVTGKTMVVEYTVTLADGSTKTYSRRINLPAEEWNAGELRTFALSISRVLVAIDDKMYKADGKTVATDSEEAVTKKDLTTTNTGNTTEYQRVLVSANWVYTDPETNVKTIVRQYDLENDTNFKTNADWIKGSDGYYYYKYPVKPGATPNTPLFDSYTAPNTSYFAGTHLEMDICVQAVQYNASATDAKPTTYYFDQYWNFPKDASGNFIAEQIKSNIPETPPTTGE